MSKKYKQKIRRNIKLLPYFYFFRDFRPVAPIFWIYLSDKLGSYTLAMSCLSMVMFFSALFEIPMGILSDKIGRKKTLILGAFLGCSESIIYIVADNINEGVYIFYVFSAVFFGLSLSLYSGTDDALSYESLSNMKKKHKFHIFNGKLISMISFSLAIACLIGGILADKSLFLWIFYLNLLAQLITLIISLFLVEPKDLAKSHETSWEYFITSFKYIMKNKRLKNLSIGRVIELSFSRINMEFRQVFLKTIVPVWLIGFTRFLRYVFGGIGYWISGKVINKFGYFEVIIGANLLSKAIGIFATLLSSVLTPFLFILNTFIRSPYHTALQSLLQKEYSNKQRATMGSILSFFTTILASIISFLVGYIADTTSSKFALILLMLCSLLGIIFFNRARKC